MFEVKWCEDLGTSLYGDKEKRKKGVGGVT